MTRAPLPALRRLFALGGAPAASHVVLSRAPAAGRLLDPMARTRIANDRSLDALARPLDISTVFSRVTDAATATKDPSIEEAGPEAGPRRGAQPKRAKQEGGAASRPATASEVASPTRGRMLTRPSVDAAAVRAAVSRSFDAPAVTRERLITKRENEFARDPRFARRDAVPPVRARSSVPPLENGSGLPVRSIAAQVGAESRVAVENAVAQIDRLLASAAPPAQTSTDSVAASRRRVSPTERPAESKISRLLASAVDRASASSRVEVPSSSPAPATTRPPLTPRVDAAPRITTQVAAPDIEPTGGGFRGLAQRTLVSSNSGQTPVRRIEPERRMPMDLTLDTLDSTVADSLSRVLEREARRHGIDLAEPRA